MFGISIVTFAINAQSCTVVVNMVFLLFYLFMFTSFLVEKGGGGGDDGGVL